MKAAFALILSAGLSSAQGLALGSGEINKAYLGSTEISKLYLGSIQIDLGATAGPLDNIKTDMLAWYDFDDATDSHASYDWDNVGSPVYSGGIVSTVTGTDYLNQPSAAGKLSTDFVPSSGGDRDCTVAVFFRPNSLHWNGDDVMVLKNGAYKSERLTSTGWRAYLVSNTLEANNSGATVDDQWYCLITTRDAATDEVELWVDGVSDGPTVSAYNNFENFCQINGDGSYAWASVWHRKLTNEEIAALFAGGITLTYDDLP
jgi:hypothetical protein